MWKFYLELVMATIVIVDVVNVVNVIAISIAIAIAIIIVIVIIIALALNLALALAFVIADDIEILYRFYSIGNVFSLLFGGHDSLRATTSHYEGHLHDL
eukprot:Awhi_evm1s10790